MKNDAPYADYGSAFPPLRGYAQSQPEIEHNLPIDALIHQRPRILQTKLAVVASEIEERLFLRNYHLKAIGHEYLEAANRLLAFDAERITPADPACRFWIEQQQRLSLEARQQRTECWQEVSKLLNDFLVIWEALEQSRARANFLKGQREEDRL